MLDVHLRGTFLTNQAAFPTCVLKAASYHRLGSHAGLTPYPLSPLFCSQGGVIAWTRSAAHEWGKFGSRQLRASGDPNAMYEENVARILGEREAHDERMQQRSLSWTTRDAKTDLTPYDISRCEGSRFITGELISSRVDSDRLAESRLQPVPIALLSD